MDAGTGPSGTLTNSLRNIGTDDIDMAPTYEDVDLFRYRRALPAEQLAN